MESTLSIHFKYFIIRLMRFISKRMVMIITINRSSSSLTVIRINIVSVSVLDVILKEAKRIEHKNHFIEYFMNKNNVSIFLFWLWVWVITTLIKFNIIAIKYIVSSVSKVSKMHCNKKKALTHFKENLNSYVSNGT